MKTHTLVTGFSGIFLLCSVITGCSTFSSMFKQTPVDPLGAEVKQQQAEVKRLQATADSLTVNRIRLWNDIQTLETLQAMTPDQIAALGVTGKEKSAPSSGSGDKSQPAEQVPAQKKGMLGRITGSVTEVFGKIGHGVKEGVKKLWPF